MGLVEAKIPAINATVGIRRKKRKLYLVRGGAIAPPSAIDGLYFRYILPV